MTSVQQSIMNFGILMVQGLVNSFGVIVMAGFAAAVKIDSFAYMPVQDFGECIFHLCGTKTVEQERWNVSKKGKFCIEIDCRFLCGYFHTGCPVCGTLMRLLLMHLRHRSFLKGVRYLPDCISFLLSDRIFIFTVWSLQRNWETTVFYCIDNNFAGDTCPFGIRPFCNPGSRNCGNLVGNPNWMVPCRYSRVSLLSFYEKIDIFQEPHIYYYKSICVAFLWKRKHS